MRILFMAQCYAPEEVSAAVLITELAADLAKHGHQVSFITGAPNYPYGRVFKGYRNGLYNVEILDEYRSSAPGVTFHLPKTLVPPVALRNIQRYSLLWWIICRPP